MTDLLNAIYILMGLVIGGFAYLVIFDRNNDKDD